MKVFNTIRCLFLSVMLTLSATTLFAQNVTVKGKVTDSRGEPVIGATVMLSSNQTVGTQTDLSGNYSISVPSNASLIYSCVGYATQNVAVAGRGSALKITWNGREVFSGDVNTERGQSVEKTVSIPADLIPADGAAKLVFSGADGKSSPQVMKIRVMKAK